MLESNLVLSKSSKCNEPPTGPSPSPQVTLSRGPEEGASAHIWFVPLSYFGPSNTPVSEHTQLCRTLKDPSFVILSRASWSKTAGDRTRNPSSKSWLPLTQSLPCLMSVAKSPSCPPLAPTPATSQGPCCEPSLKGKPVPALYVCIFSLPSSVV